MATDVVTPMQRTPRRSRRWIRVAGWYALLCLLSLLVLFPLWMAVARALSNPFDYIEAGLPPYPVSIDWGVFGEVFQGGTLLRAMGLSLLVGALITGANLVTSIMVAYAMAFIDFPLKKFWFTAILSSLLLPAEVTLLGNIRTIRELEWLNSIQGLTLPFAASAFGIFMLRQAFMGVPRDLRDAARLDGFGHVGFVCHVVLPVTRPVIGSLVLLTVLSSWNSYLWPRAITTEQSWQTLQIALRSLSSMSVERANVGVAAALIAAVPVVVFLLAFQKQIVRGLTAGAVKG